MTVKLSLIARRDHFFHFIWCIAQGMEDSHNATKTRPGDGPDAKAFLLQTANDSDMRVAFYAATAQRESDIHRGVRFQVSGVETAFDCEPAAL